jgi:hypothetical protein
VPDHVNDPADHPPVINPRQAARARKNGSIHRV